jgi:hypothetical protein
MEEKVEKEIKQILERLISEDNSNALSSARPELMDDKEFIQKVIKIHGPYLNYASDNLKKDKSLAFEAIRNYSYSFEYIDESLKNDKEIVTEALKQNCRILEIVPESLQTDPEVLMVGISQDIDYTLGFIQSRDLFHVLLDNLSIYFLFKSENVKMEIPHKIHHQIGMKLLKLENYEDDIIEIFEKDIEMKNEFLNESCYELGKIYFFGKKKNFTKSKQYFDICIKNEYLKNESLGMIHKIDFYSKGLNDEELEIFEKFSNSKSYVLKKRLAKSMDATIYLCEKVSTSQEFVLKKFQIAELNFNEALKEVLYLKLLTNEFICEIVDFYIEELEIEEDILFFFCIVMPFYKCDLGAYFLQNNPTQEVWVSFIELFSSFIESLWIYPMEWSIFTVKE